LFFSFRIGISHYLIIAFSYQLIQIVPLTGTLLFNKEYYVISELRGEILIIISSQGSIRELDLKVTTITEDDFVLVIETCCQGQNRLKEASIFEAIDAREKYEKSMIEGFLTKEECENLIVLAEPHLKRSKIGGDKRCISDIKTISTAFLNNSDNDLIHNIKKRVKDLFDHSYELDIQYTEYCKGQEFHVHIDAFNLLKNRNIIKEKGQRKQTLIIYLNDVIKGGETYFPEIKKLVKPGEGMAFGFNNLNSSGVRNHFPFIAEGA